MPYLTGQVLTQADIAALFASGTYTPTLGNMAVGTGGGPINSAKYTFVGFPAGGVLTVEGTIKFGTTAPTLPGASAESISLPAGYAMIDTTSSRALAGSVVYFDTSAVAEREGAFQPISSTTVGLVVRNVTGANINFAALTATVPFTWATGDSIYYTFSARCTGP